MFDFKGFYHCGKCGPCRSTKPAPRKRTTFTSHQTFKQYPIKNFIVCGTRNVTYVEECPLGSNMLEEHQELNKLVSILQIYARDFQNVSNHFGLKHQNNPAEITFYAIYSVKGHGGGVPI